MRTVDRFREALRMIGEGTVCPYLFPQVKDVWELQAKTAVAIALASLEQEQEAPDETLPRRTP